MIASQSSVFDTFRLRNIFGEAIGFSGKAILTSFVKSVTTLIENANFGYREVGEPGAALGQFHQNYTFTRADPKRAKKTDRLTVYFALLGSMHIKAAVNRQ